jgi:hypothetical protein
MVALLVAILAPVLVDAQSAAASSEGEKMLARDVAATTRYGESLEVPRKGKPNLAVRAELGSWISTDKAREITVPPQGFYIATLGNGSVITTIDGEEKQRRAGDIWAVQDGQSMTVKILDKKQENVVLHILSIRPSH